MKNLAIIHALGKYDVGGLVRFLIGAFNDPYYRNILREQYNLNVVTSLDYSINSKTDEVFLQELNNDNKFNNTIALGIHPYGLCFIDRIPAKIKKEKNIKTVAWINDPHYFAYFAKERKETIVQNYAKKYSPIFLPNLNFLLTPSPIYFKNLNINEHDSKIIDMFYFLDPSLFKHFTNKPYNSRNNQIILSGCIDTAYKSRMEFINLKQSNEQYNELIYRLDHPGYKNNEHMTELKYYNKLSEFKGAFVGHHVFPINFVLAKHIEVLMCGCLGFFEPNDLLLSQLGLKEFVHYVPCYSGQEIIKEYNFYKTWLESSEGEKIAKQGQEYVMSVFGEKQIDKFFTFLKNC